MFQSLEKKILTLKLYITRTLKELFFFVDQMCLR